MKTSMRSANGWWALALGISLAAPLAGCEKQAQSGRYCNERDPTICLQVTFSEKNSVAEVKILQGADVVYEGEDKGVMYDTIKLSGVKGGPYEGNVQITFDKKNPQRCELEVIGSGKLADGFLKK